MAEKRISRRKTVAEWKIKQSRKCHTYSYKPHPRRHQEEQDNKDNEGGEGSEEKQGTKTNKQ